MHILILSYFGATVFWSQEISHIMDPITATYHDAAI